MRKILAAAALIAGVAGIAHAKTPDPKSLIEVKANGSWGVLDQNGRIIVPIEYDLIFIGDDGTIYAKKGEEETFFDTAGRQVPYYENADRNGYFTVRGEQGRYGLVDGQGRQILPAMFAYIHPFDDAGHYVVGYRGRASVIDPAGGLLFPQSFASISSLGKNGLAIASSDVGTYGAIDRTGAWVIEPGPFEYIYQFYDDGLASAQSGGKWGFIDRTGRWVIAPISEYSLWIEPFNKLGTTAVMIGGKWGFIDRSGRVVVKPRFDDVRQTEGETYIARIGEETGLIDGLGRYLLKPVFTKLWGFSSEGLAKAWQGDRSFFIDRKGRSVFGNQFENVGSFSGAGWAAAKSGGKWGAIDTRGNWILEPKYQCVDICYDEPLRPPTIYVYPSPEK